MTDPVEAVPDRFDDLVAGNVDELKRERSDKPLEFRLRLDGSTADVYDPRKHEATIRGINRFQLDFHSDRRAILAPPEPGTTATGRPTLRLICEVSAAGRVDRPYRLGHQQADALPNQFVSRVAKLSFQFGVDDLNRSLDVGYQEPVRRCFDRESKGSRPVEAVTCHSHQLVGPRALTVAHQSKSHSPGSARPDVSAGAERCWAATVTRTGAAQRLKSPPSSSRHAVGR